jgi:hypothetical protein
MTIRVTKELKDLVDRTAEHCGLSITEIIRRCVNWTRRHGGEEELVTESEKGKAVTFLRADFELPQDIELVTFRNVLRKRCEDALTKPSAKEVCTNLLCMNGDGLTPQAEED